MSCPCTQPTAVVPPLVKLIRAGTTPTSGCAMGQPYETLSITTFVPQAVAATQTVKVCSAASYLIGTCVLLVDSSGNTQVQRVTGHVGTDTLTLTAYTNDYSDTTTTLTGVIYMQPVGICPPDTTSDTECFRTYAETLDAFVMPAEDGTVEVTFTEAVSFPYGAEVYIEGAGWMMVDNPPTGGFVACSESHYMTNLGTAGNEDPGETITGGAYVTIDRAPVDTFTPTSGTISTVFQFDCGLGSINTITGGNSANSAPVVLAWAANCMITGMTFLDPASVGAPLGMAYQTSLQYSSNSGGSWTYLFQNAIEGNGYMTNGNPVTVSIQLPAGTYLWRFVSTDMTGTPGAPTPLTPPTYTNLSVSMLAVRTTASVS